MINNGIRVQTLYNSWAYEHYERKAEIDSLKLIIDANKRIYLKAEDRYKAQIKSSVVYTIIASLIIMVLANAK